MDPNARLTRFEHALIDGDLHEARDAYLELRRWVATGGALPTGYRTAGGLLAHLDRRLAQASALLMACGAR